MKWISIAAILLFTSCAAPTGALPRFHEVDPGKFYRSSQPDEAGYDAMVKIGIHTVVKLNTDLLPQEREWAQAHGIKLIEVALPGIAGPSDQAEGHVQELLDDPALQPVLVHCEQGRDRTGLAAALYRVFVQHWSAIKAHDEWMDLGHSPLLFGMDLYFWRAIGHPPVPAQ